MVWVDPGDFKLDPLDRVDVETPGGRIQGEVFVASEQLRGGRIDNEGRVIAVMPRVGGHRPVCETLPGADMPVLDEEGAFGEYVGLVIGIDAVHRTVRVRDADGIEHEVQVGAGGQHESR